MFTELAELSKRIDNVTHTPLLYINLYTLAKSKDSGFTFYQNRYVNKQKWEKISEQMDRKSLDRAQRYITV